MSAIVKETVVELKVCPGYLIFEGLFGNRNSRTLSSSDPN